MAVFGLHLDAGQSSWTLLFSEDDRKYVHWFVRPFDSGARIAATRAYRFILLWLLEGPRPGQASLCLEKRARGRLQAYVRRRERESGISLPK